MHEKVLHEPNGTITAFKQELSWACHLTCSQPGASDDPLPGHTGLYCASFLQFTLL